MSQWQKWRAAFDARSLRERLGLAVLGLVIVVLLWTELLWDEQRAAAQAMRQSLNTVQTQQAATEKQIQAVLTAARRDPDAALKRRHAQLQAQMTKLDRKLAAQMGDLIDPAGMARVLEAILTRHSRLRLLHMENLPTRPLLADTGGQSEGDETAPASGDGRVGVYRHGLVMTFSGAYLDLLAYLKELDALPWDFYWDALELQVEDYPRATITLHVHTLSLEEGWIGV